MSENQNSETGVAVSELQSGWHTHTLSTPPMININVLIEKKMFHSFGFVWFGRSLAVPSAESLNLCDACADFGACQVFTRTAQAWFVTAWIVRKSILVWHLGPRSEIFSVAERLDAIFHTLVCKTTCQTNIRVFYRGYSFEMLWWCALKLELNISIFCLFQFSWMTPELY